MRNLKKILALALVFAMAFTFTASAADFTDAAEIGAKYVDDVNMLVELGVIAGYPDGSFGPQKNITRAEFAKMAYTIKYGSDTDGNLFAAQKSNFWDVEGNASVAWAKGYINYCANQNIVSGVGGGKFNPQGNITVAEATKMLLVILGCDPAKEGFTGANWVANVTAKAIDLGIYNGWTGDPSVLATRELVAKLMHNTIFSSVYTYSAITGMGSQMNALGTGYNETLGEKTMNLQKVTGIVVANDRYFINTDEEGATLLYVGKDDKTHDLIDAPAAEDESIVYYEGKDENGNTFVDTITLDRDLDDDMLGAKVNVYFTADTIENNGRLDFKNIEVVGNVLVHSDTVAYTVPALATDVMPDGESSSSSEIRPYITFTVDGVEKQIKASTKVARIAKDQDAQDDVAVEDEFNPYAYVLKANSLTADGYLANAQDDEFLGDMGMPIVGQYRFVSVDGGKTYSYMFKMVDAVNSGYGSVTSISETAGSIRIAGIPGLTGTQDLEEVVINGEVATDDVVVVYRANGKLVVEKVNSFTTAVESFTDKGVMLNGSEFFAWDQNDEVYPNYASIFAYYNDERGAQNANTTYYTYQNLIMEISADDEVAAAANYAVVLRSYYDADMDTAYVKVGFADGTEGTYKVGKLYTPVASNLTDARNNQAQELADNSLFGYVVSYKLRDDGSIDLSGQDFKDVGNKDCKLSTYSIADGSKVVDKGQFAGKYSMNDATVVFALYGNPAMKEVDTSVVVDSAVAGDKYAPVKAKAYKLAELESLTANKLDNLWMQDYKSGSQAEIGDAVGSYVVNSAKNANQYIVAAAITVGQELSKGAATYDADSSIAYVVSATQRYNSATDYYYAEITLIDENGLLSTTTVDDVQNESSQSMLLEVDGIGKLDGKRLNSDKDPVANWSGRFVRYELNADGKIAMLDTNDDFGKALTVQISDGKTAYAKNTLYLVNVTTERGNILSFYDAIDIKDVKGTATRSLEYAEDGVTIVGIDEEAYGGAAFQAKLPSRTEELKAEDGGNAVIYVNEDGEIEYVFSFSANYIKK